MKNVWLVRAVLDDLDRFETFKEENVIAIGWSKLPDMRKNSIDDIRNMLKVAYPEYDTSGKLGQALTIVHSFVNKLRQGDLVLVPTGDQVQIGIIESDYYHNPAKVTEGYCHQRRVKWLLVTSLDGFHGVVKILLKSRKTVVRLQNRSDTVWAMVSMEPELVQQTLTADLQTKASNIDIQEETKKNIMQQLGSNDPAWRLKIALQIMKANGKL